jgi:hypothetical protein
MWCAGAGPIAAYALAAGLVSHHSGAELPAKWRYGAIAAALVVGAGVGFIYQQSSLFPPTIKALQGMVVLGTLLLLAVLSTVVGVLFVVVPPLASLLGLYFVGKRQKALFPLTLCCWVLVAWWLQTYVALSTTPELNLG